jgi:hypothetical protein
MAPTSEGSSVARPEQNEPPSPAVDVGELTFTLAEVKQLWWFLDGAMMAPDVRRHLREGWGFCPRHSWGLGVVECQLRGGTPFATAILYEDLTRRAARLHNRSIPLLREDARSALEPKRPCFTCEYAELGGEVEPSFRNKQERVNRLDRVRRRVEEARAEWEPRACPLCHGGSGLVCRQHILAGAEPQPGLRPELEALADRLKVFVGSQTVGGAPAGPLERAAWIEALGWFSGWDYARKLADPDEPYTGAGDEARRTAVSANGLYQRKRR